MRVMGNGDWQVKSKKEAEEVIFSLAADYGCKVYWGVANPVHEDHIQVVCHRGAWSVRYQNGEKEYSSKTIHLPY